MIRKLEHLALVVLAAQFASSSVAFAQAPTAQRHANTTGLLLQPQPLTLPHLYWHFLLYQNHLDVKAAAEGGQSQAALNLRNHMQVRLGLSDASFTLIHTSAARLANEIQSLDSQAAAIKAGSPAPTAAAYSQLVALTSQRDRDIQAEVLYLKQNLPASDIKALEAFLVSYFSPKNSGPHSSGPPSEVTNRAVQP